MHFLDMAELSTAKTLQHCKIWASSPLEVIIHTTFQTSLAADYQNLYLSGKEPLMTHCSMQLATTLTLESLWPSTAIWRPPAVASNLSERSARSRQRSDGCTWLCSYPPLHSDGRNDPVMRQKVSITWVQHTPQHMGAKTQHVVYDG